MTVPVLTIDHQAARWTPMRKNEARVSAPAGVEMLFYLASAAPTPTHADVAVTALAAVSPGRQFYVKSFKTLFVTSPREIERQRAQLIQYLEDNNLAYDAARAFTAQYNGPFSLLR